MMGIPIDVRDRPMGEDLRALYVEEGLSVAEISAMVGHPRGTISTWLRVAGTEFRAGEQWREGVWSKVVSHKNVQTGEDTFTGEPTYVEMDVLECGHEIRSRYLDPRVAHYESKPRTPTQRRCATCEAKEPKPMPCPARFIKQRLKDPVQDARMDCSFENEDHRGRHKNSDGDLYWSKGMEIDLKDLLDAAYDDNSQGVTP